MKFIDPHIHCVSRTTEDYRFMQRCGVVGVSEPAFGPDLIDLLRPVLRIIFGI